MIPLEGEPNSQRASRLWRERARERRPLLAAKLAAILKCHPDDVRFQDKAQYDNAVDLVRNRTRTVPVTEFPDRASALAMIEQAFRETTGEAVLLSLEASDCGGIIGNVQSVLRSLDELARLGEESLIFVSPNGDFGVVLSQEEGVAPNLPRWAQIWHGGVKKQ